MADGPGVIVTSSLSGRSRPALARLCAAVAVLAAGLVFAALPDGFGQERDTARRTAILLDIDGAIGPATTGYLREGFEAAADRDAALIILRMDTPGGLASAMRDIIRDILASPIPVVTYVSPSGARAASAGTYIVYASHLAAMAPGTNIGAATPVQLGGGSLPFGGTDDSDDDSDGDTSEEKDRRTPRDASAAKALNDAVAYIRGLAELHGRNADWAEEAVREAASLSASAAHDRGVVEIIAPDLEDLLAQADGRTVEAGGETVALETGGLRIVEIAPDWRTRILSVITDPNLAFILMLIGIYGIIFELVSPGAIFPGTIGGISLLVALFALNLLPIDYAGAGLVLLGIALMVGEAFAPSFGVLGIGGAIAFALGSLFMFEEAPGFELSIWVVVTATAASAALLAIALAVVVRTARHKVVTGDTAMIGAPAEVLTWSGEQGEIHVHGERWRARSAEPLAAGQRVRVTGRTALVLTVEPVPSEEPS